MMIPVIVEPGLPPKEVALGEIHGLVEDDCDDCEKYEDRVDRFHAELGRVDRHKLAQPVS
ncbi:hypothetical protein GCM10020255_036480 [Rhodococcus baikonurensis]